MSKILTTRQFAAIKRVAQNVNPLIVKRQKLTEKLAQLADEYNKLGEEIYNHELGIQAMTNGFTSEDLVIKKIIESGKYDSNNNPIKITKYDYNPETIIYNGETNTYEIIKEIPTQIETEPIELVETEELN